MGDWEKQALPVNVRRTKSQVQTRTKILDKQHRYKSGRNLSISPDLQCAGDAVINKAAPSGRGSDIALRWAEACDSEVSSRDRALNFW